MSKNVREINIAMNKHGQYSGRNEHQQHGKRQQQQFIFIQYLELNIII